MFEFSKASRCLCIFKNILMFVLKYLDVCIFYKEYLDDYAFLMLSSMLVHFQNYLDVCAFLKVSRCLILSKSISMFVYFKKYLDVYEFLKVPRCLCF